MNQLGFKTYFIRAFNDAQSFCELRKLKKPVAVLPIFASGLLDDFKRPKSTSKTRCILASTSDGSRVVTHFEIRNELHRSIQIERENTKELLLLINKADASRSYAEFGYSSLFKWLVGEFKLSSGAAGRRLQAAQLLRSVPDVAEKLNDGSLNLSTMCQTQAKINAQEKATDTKVSAEQKAEALAKVENKSSNEAEKILVQSFPEAAPEATKPQNRKLKNSKTRCPVDFDDDQLKLLQRAKELLSHQFPDGDNAKVLAYALKLLIKQKDPLAKSTESNPRRFKKESKAQVRRDVMQSTDGQCAFVGVDGHVCKERAQIQTDHIVPLGMGGPDTLENQRPLCREHNLLMAQRAYGKKHMDRFRKNKNASTPSNHGHAGSQ